MATDSLDGLEGKTITITPKNGRQAYTGVVRSVHGAGVTIWMDADAKDEGEVRTVHLISVKNGQQADADYTVA